MSDRSSSSLVAAVVVFSVWKWRVPPDDDAEGPPIHGHTGLEIVWTAVPAILVIALGIVSAVRAFRKRKGQRQRAAGHERSASSSRGSSSIRTTVGVQVRRARTPCRPAGAVHDGGRRRPALLLRVKQSRPEDGRRSGNRDPPSTSRPTRTGEFAVICAELCGLGHATMRANARVVTQAEFDEWIEEQKA